MEIVQFLTDSLGDASYLLVSGGEAAMIDPQRDVRPFVHAAEQRGAAIRYVFETHVHNDYLSGGRELAALGAQVVAPAKGKFEFPHIAVDDGELIAIGGAQLRVVRAPGHTFEHTAYLALDEQAHVSGAFTGGTILMAGEGRTDLLGPDNTPDLTRMQWESARRIAALLPATGEILPTHGAGSFCSMTGTCLETRAPLSLEQMRNPALTLPFEAFRAAQLAIAAPIPGYYPKMAPINRRGPAVYGEPPRPALLDSPALERIRGAGARVVDVRRRADWAERHIAGSLAIESGGSMLAYFGWLLPFDAPVALVCDDAAQAESVTVDLFRIGFEHVQGWFPGEAIPRSGVETAALPVVTVEEAAATVAQGATPVLDVRFAYEQEATPLPGAIRLPIDRPMQLLAGAPKEALIVCASGYRAAAAASLLLPAGHRLRALIDGGAAEVLAALR